MNISKLKQEKFEIELKKPPKRFKIVQTLDSWFTLKPEIKDIKSFRFYFTAWLYRYVHYEFAESCWKADFTWEIIPLHPES